MQQQDEVSCEEEFEDDQPENEGDVSGDGNFGFRAMTEPQKERREERALDTPTCLALRQQINRLLCRYPQLRLRSSETTMRQLAQYDEKELENVLTNANNDLAAIRGVPMAEFIIHTVGGLIDAFVLPGFLARCQADDELKNDVEAEATLLSGGFGNRTNIVFRAANHAFTQKFHPDAPLPKRMRMTPPEEAQEEERYFENIRAPQQQQNPYERSETARQ